MKTRRISAVVRFWAEVPEDDREADEWADVLSEKIIAAVDALDEVMTESTDVPDWTEADD